MGAFVYNDGTPILNNGINQHNIRVQQMKDMKSNLVAE